MRCTICGNDKMQILAKRLRLGTGSVYYCPQCDYGMLQAGFDNASEYYDKEYRKKFKDNIADAGEQSPEEIYRERRMYQQTRLNIISDYFDRERDFLEIGCSAGQFLSAVRNEFRSVTGIELSTGCARFVEENWKIPVYSQEISDIDWKERQFDYISFFQVLEHIVDPQRFLTDVHKRLRNDGKVFIEIPDLEDPLRKLWKIPAYEEFYFHEAHLSYFSERSVSKILNKCGFKVENIYHIQDYNLLNHIYWYFNNGPQENGTFGLHVPAIDFDDKDERVKCAGDAVNALLAEMNQKYFDILSKYKLTSNLFVVASKSKETAS